jgi:phosphate starvation-inducible PhoH-like protein
MMCSSARAMSIFGAFFFSLASSGKSMVSGKRGGGANLGGGGVVAGFLKKGFGGGVGGGGGSGWVPDLLLKGQQRVYADLLANASVSVVVATGPAGSGKTMLACREAARLLLDGRMDRVIMTRPVVTVREEDLGYLPGGIGSKMDPYMRPLLDTFGEMIPEHEIMALIKSKRIEICPLGFMRGRTFKRSFIIADEMQNACPAQMLMLLTRLGMDSRMAITGDLAQSDVSRVSNGLRDLMERLSLCDDGLGLIRSVELGDSDVHRSEVVKSVLKLYRDITQ